MPLLSNFCGDRPYASEHANHLLYEYLGKSWIHLVSIRHILKSSIIFYQNLQQQIFENHFKASNDL